VTVSNDETISIMPGGDKDRSAETRAVVWSAKLGCIGSIAAAILGAVLPLYLQQQNKAADATIAPGERTGRPERRPDSGRGGRSPKVVFEVKSPADLASRGQPLEVSIQGASSGLPSDVELWFNVQEEGEKSSRLYGPASRALDGTWRVDLALRGGDSEDTALAKTFRLQALLAPGGLAKLARRAQQRSILIPEFEEKAGQSFGLVSEWTVRRRKK
jgi:hypothetical protein